MIIQYILLITEWNYYLNMISDIQGYKFNFYKNEKNEFIIKLIVTFFIGYIILLLFIFYYIDVFNINFKNFWFIVFIYFLWDSAFFLMFDKGVYHWPVLLFDMFVVGGFCIVITQYIINNYYNILKNYTPLLFIIYLLTMLLFFYECYKYNPDL